MTVHYYRDFVLYADSFEFEDENVSRRPIEYWVRVFDSPEGEGEEPESVTMDNWDQIDQWRQALADRTISDDDLKEFGRQMGRMILPPVARDLFFHSLSALADSEDGLRVRLRLFPALDVLPWEYTRVPPPASSRDVNELIFLNPKLSIVRHQPVATPAKPFRTGAEHRLVVAMASPRLYLPLKLAEEQSAIQDLLQRGSGINDVYCPDYRTEPHSMGATEGDLATALTEQTDIFHFSGHGKFEESQGPELHTVEGIGQIILAEPDGRPHALVGDTLGRLLQTGGVRLAILGACETAERDIFNAWSSVASSLLKRGIPAVIAMQFSVHDNMTQHFMSVLYNGLVMGDTVDSAVSQARFAMWRRNPADRDWGAPVLYMRTSGGCILGAVLDAEARCIAQQASAQTAEINAAFQHWMERQALANREQLEYLESSGDILDATETDLLILTRSALACDADTQPWVSRFATVGDALVRWLELGETPPTSPVVGEAGKLLGVDVQPVVDDATLAERSAALNTSAKPLLLKLPVPIVAPSSISHSAVSHADFLTRQTACLALLALGVQAALALVDSALETKIADKAKRRQRRAELYGVLAENDPLTAQEVSRRINYIQDRFAVWRWRTGRYWRRERGRIWKLSLRGALAAGLALGCYRALLAMPRQEIVGERFLIWFVPGFFVSFGLLLGMFLAGPLLRYNTRHPAPDKARRVAALGVVTGAVGFALADILLKGMRIDFEIGTVGGVELGSLPVSLLVGAGLNIGLHGLAYGGPPRTIVHHFMRLLAVACVCMITQLPILCEFRLTVSTEWYASTVFIPTHQVQTGYEKYDFMMCQFRRCSPESAASRRCCFESCIAGYGGVSGLLGVAGCVEEWLSIFDAGIVGTLLAIFLALGVQSSGKALRWLWET